MADYGGGGFYGGGGGDFYGDGGATSTPPVKSESRTPVSSTQRAVSKSHTVFLELHAFVWRFTVCHSLCDNNNLTLPLLSYISRITETSRHCVLAQ